LKVAILGVSSSYRSFSGASLVDNLYNSINADVIILSDEKVFSKYHVPYRKFSDVNPKDYDVVFIPSCVLTKDEERKIGKFNTNTMITLVSSLDNRTAVNESIVDNYIFKDSIMLFPTKKMQDIYKRSIKKSFVVTFPYASEYKIGRKNNRCFITSGLISEINNFDILTTVLEQVNCRFEMIFGLGSTKGLDKATELFGKIVSNGNVLMSYCKYGYNKTFLISETTKSAAYVNLYDNTSFYGTRYSELEAIDLGCIPISLEDSKEVYEKLGLRGLFYSDAESLMDAMKKIMSGNVDAKIIDENRLALREMNRKFSADMENIFKECCDFSFTSIRKSS
jgi:hypothetical protein